MKVEAIWFTIFVSCTLKEDMRERERKRERDRKENRKRGSMV